MRELPPALQRAIPVPLSERLTWSYDDLARATGLSVPTLRGLLRQGLPHCRVGDRVLFVPAAARDWFAGRLITLAATEVPPPDGDDDFDTAE